MARSGLTRPSNASPTWVTPLSPFYQDRLTQAVQVHMRPWTKLTQGTSTGHIHNYLCAWHPLFVEFGIGQQNILQTHLCATHSFCGWQEVNRVLTHLAKATFEGKLHNPNGWLNSPLREVRNWLDRPP